MTLDHLAVDGNLFARSHHEDIAYLHLLDGEVGFLPIVEHACRLGA